MSNIFVNGLNTNRMQSLSTIINNMIYNKSGVNINSNAAQNSALATLQAAANNNKIDTSYSSHINSLQTTIDSLNKQSSNVAAKISEMSTLKNSYAKTATTLDSFLNSVKNSTSNSVYDYTNTNPEAASVDLLTSNITSQRIDYNVRQVATATVATSNILKGVDVDRNTKIVDLFAGNFSDNKINSTRTDIKGSTTMAQLGVTTGSFEIGGHMITVNGADTVDSVIEKLGVIGYTAGFDADNKFYISSETESLAIRNQNTNFAEIMGLTVSKGTFAINGYDLTISDHTTVGNLLDTINSDPKYGVGASLVDNKIELVANMTGNVLIEVTKGSSNFTNAIGFTSGGTLRQDNLHVGNEGTAQSLTGTAAVTLDTTFSSGDFSITNNNNGTDETVNFTVDEGDTLEDIIRKINESSLDVTASLEGGKLKIVQNQIGSEYNMVIEAGSSDFTAVVGMTDETSSTGILSPGLDADYFTHLDGTVTIDDPDDALAITTGSFKINGKTIQLVEGSVNSAIDQINLYSEETGVIAELKDDKVILRNRLTGSDVLYVEGGTSNFGKVTGLTTESVTSARATIGSQGYASTLVGTETVNRDTMVSASAIKINGNIVNISEGTMVNAIDNINAALAYTNVRASIQYGRVVFTETRNGALPISVEDMSGNFGAVTGIIGYTVVGGEEEKYGGTRTTVTATREVANAMQISSSTVKINGVEINVSNTIRDAINTINSNSITTGVEAYINTENMLTFRATAYGEQNVEVQITSGDLGRVIGMGTYSTVSGSSSQVERIFASVTGSITGLDEYSQILNGSTLSVSTKDFSSGTVTSTSINIDGATTIGELISRINAKTSTTKVSARLNSDGAFELVATDETVRTIGVEVGGRGDLGRVTGLGNYVIMGATSDGSVSNQTFSSITGLNSVNASMQITDTSFTLTYVNDAGVIEEKTYTFISNSASGNSVSQVAGTAKAYRVDEHGTPINDGRTVSTEYVVTKAGNITLQDVMNIVNTGTLDGSGVDNNWYVRADIIDNKFVFTSRAVGPFDLNIQVNDNADGTKGDMGRVIGMATSAALNYDPTQNRKNPAYIIGGTSENLSLDDEIMGTNTFKIWMTRDNSSLTGIDTQTGTGENASRAEIINIGRVDNGDGTSHNMTVGELIDAINAKASITKVKASLEGGQFKLTQIDDLNADDASRYNTAGGANTAGEGDTIRYEITGTGDLNYVIGFGNYTTGYQTSTGSLAQQRRTTLQGSTTVAGSETLAAGSIVLTGLSVENENTYITINIDRGETLNSVLSKITNAGVNVTANIQGGKVTLTTDMYTDLNISTVGDTDFLRVAGLGRFTVGNAISSAGHGVDNGTNTHAVSKSTTILDGRAANGELTLDGCGVEVVNKTVAEILDNINNLKNSRGENVARAELVGNQLTIQLTREGTTATNIVAKGDAARILGLAEHTTNDGDVVIKSGRDEGSHVHAVSKSYADVDGQAANGTLTLDGVVFTEAELAGKTAAQIVDIINNKTYGAGQAGTQGTYVARAQLITVATADMTGDGNVTAADVTKAQNEGNTELANFLQKIINGQANATDGFLTIQLNREGTGAGNISATADVARILGISDYTVTAVTSTSSAGVDKGTNYHAVTRSYAYIDGSAADGSITLDGVTKDVTGMTAAQIVDLINSTNNASNTGKVARAELISLANADLNSDGRVDASDVQRARDEGNTDLADYLTQVLNGTIDGNRVGFLTIQINRESTGAGTISASGDAARLLRISNVTTAAGTATAGSGTDKGTHSHAVSISYTKNDGYAANGTITLDGVVITEAELAGKSAAQIVDVINNKKYGAGQAGTQGTYVARAELVGDRLTIQLNRAGTTAAEGITASGDVARVLGLATYTTSGPSLVAGSGTDQGTTQHIVSSSHAYTDGYVANGSLTIDGVSIDVVGKSVSQIVANINAATNGSGVNVARAELKSDGTLLIQVNKNNSTAADISASGDAARVLGLPTFTSTNGTATSAQSTDNGSTSHYYLTATVANDGYVAYGSLTIDGAGISVIGKNAAQIVDEINSTKNSAGVNVARATLSGTTLTIQVNKDSSGSGDISISGDAARVLGIDTWSVTGATVTSAGATGQGSHTHGVTTSTAKLDGVVTGGSLTIDGVAITVLGKTAAEIVANINAATNGSGQNVARAQLQDSRLVIQVLKEGSTGADVVANGDAARVLGLSTVTIAGGTSTAGTASAAQWTSHTVSKSTAITTGKVANGTLTIGGKSIDVIDKTAAEIVANINAARNSENKLVARATLSGTNLTIQVDADGSSSTDIVASGDVARVLGLADYSTTAGSGSSTAGTNNGTSSYGLTTSTAITSGKVANGTLTIDGVSITVQDKTAAQIVANINAATNASGQNVAVATLTGTSLSIRLLRNGSTAANISATDDAARVLGLDNYSWSAGTTTAAKGTNYGAENRLTVTSTVINESAASSGSLTILGVNITVANKTISQIVTNINSATDSDGNNIASATYNSTTKQLTIELLQASSASDLTATGQVGINLGLIGYTAPGVTPTNGTGSDNGNVTGNKIIKSTVLSGGGTKILDGAVTFSNSTGTTIQTVDLSGKTLAEAVTALNNTGKVSASLSGTNLRIEITNSSVNDINATKDAARVLGLTNYSMAQATVVEGTPAGEEKLAFAAVSSHGNTKIGTAINSVAGLKGITGGNYYLTSDIDLSGEEWVSLEANNVNLYGNGYKITGLHGHSLFGEVDCLNVSDLYIEADTVYDAILAVDNESGTIDNVHVVGTVIDSGKNHVGGLFAGIDGCSGTASVVTNCSANVNIVLSAAYEAGWFGMAGLLIGHMDSTTIQNCYVSGSINVASSTAANVFIGGLCGHAEFDCVVDSNIVDGFGVQYTDLSSLGMYVGMFVGTFQSGSCTNNQYILAADPTDIDDELRPFINKSERDLTFVKARQYGCLYAINTSCSSTATFSGNTISDPIFTSSSDTTTLGKARNKYTWTSATAINGSITVARDNMTSINSAFIGQTAGTIKIWSSALNDYIKKGSDYISISYSATDSFSTVMTKIVQASNGAAQGSIIGNGVAANGSTTFSTGSVYGGVYFEDTGNLLSLVGMNCRSGYSRSSTKTTETPTHWAGISNTTATATGGKTITNGNVALAGQTAGKVKVYLYDATTNTKTLDVGTVSYTATESVNSILGKINNLTYEKQTSKVVSDGSTAYVTGKLKDGVTNNASLNASNKVKYKAETMASLVDNRVNIKVDVYDTTAQYLVFEDADGGNFVAQSGLGSGVDIAATRADTVKEYYKGYGNGLATLLGTKELHTDSLAGLVGGSFTIKVGSTTVGTVTYTANDTITSINEKISALSYTFNTNHGPGDYTNSYVHSGQTANVVSGKVVYTATGGASLNNYKERISFQVYNTSNQNVSVVENSGNFCALTGLIAGSSSSSKNSQTYTDYMGITKGSSTFTSSVAVGTENLAGLTGGKLKLNLGGTTVATVTYDATDTVDTIVSKINALTFTYATGTASGNTTSWQDGNASVGADGKVNYTAHVTASHNHTDGKIYVTVDNYAITQQQITFTDSDGGNFGALTGLLAGSWNGSRTNETNSDFAGIKKGVALFEGSQAINYEDLAGLKGGSFDVYVGTTKAGTITYTADDTLDSIAQKIEALTYTYDPSATTTSKLGDLDAYDDYEFMTVLKEGTHTYATDTAAVAAGYTAVHTAAELASAIASNKKICLMNNIDLTGVSWTVRDYSKDFHGNGYVISGVSGRGLFHSLDGTASSYITVKDLKVEGAVDGYDVGGIITGIANYVNFDNVVASGSVIERTSDGWNNGGFVGWASNINFTNCIANVNVNTYTAAGGFVGQAAGTVNVNNCLSMGTISVGNHAAGGIVGYLNENAVLNINNTIRYGSNITAVGGSYGMFVGTAMNNSRINCGTSASNMNKVFFNGKTTNCPMIGNIKSGVTHNTGVVSTASRDSVTAMLASVYAVNHNSSTNQVTYTGNISASHNHNTGKFLVTADVFNNSATSISFQNDTGNFTVLSGLNGGTITADRNNTTDKDEKGLVAGTAKLKGSQSLNGVQDLAAQTTGTITLGFQSTLMTDSVNPNIIAANSNLSVTYGVNDSVDTILAKIKNEMFYDYKTNIKVTTPFTDGKGANDDNSFNTGTLRSEIATLAQGKISGYTGNQNSYVDSDGYIHYIGQFDAYIEDGKVVIAADAYYFKKTSLVNPNLGASDIKESLTIADTGNFSKIAGLIAGSQTTARSASTNTDWKGLQKGLATYTSSMVLRTCDLAGLNAGQFDVYIGSTKVGTVTYGANDTIEDILGRLNALEYDYNTNYTPTTPFSTGLAGADDREYLSALREGSHTYLSEASAISAGYTAVHTAAELDAAIAANKKICLMNNIDLTGVTWTARSFTNSFHGNGYVISGLSGTSLFNSVSGTYSSAVKIEDVRIEAKNVNCSGDAGILAQQISFTVVDKVAVTGNVSGAGAGGIVGFLDNATLKNSVSYANVQGSSNAGGLIGRVTGTVSVTECISLGTVKATAAGSVAGGITGEVLPGATLNVKDCTRVGSSISALGYMGSVAGKVSGSRINYTGTNKFITDYTNISYNKFNNNGAGVLENSGVTSGTCTAYTISEASNTALNNTLNSYFAAYVAADGKVHYKGNISATHNEDTGRIYVTSDVFGSSQAISFKNDTGNFTTITGLLAGSDGGSQSTSINYDSKGITRGQAKLTGSVDLNGVNDLAGVTTGATATGRITVKVGGYTAGTFDYDKDVTIAQLVAAINDMQYEYNTGKYVTSPFTSATNLAQNDDNEYNTGKLEDNTTQAGHVVGNKLNGGEIYYTSQLQCSIVDDKIVITSDAYGSGMQITVEDTGTLAQLVGIKSGGNWTVTNRTNTVNTDHNGITRGQATLVNSKNIKANDLSGLSDGTLTIQLVTNLGNVGGTESVNNKIQTTLSSLSVEYYKDDTVSDIVSRINNLQYDYKTDKRVSTPFVDNTGFRAGTDNDDNQYNTGKLEDNATQASYVDADGYIHYIAQLQASYNASTGKITITSDVYDTNVKIRIVDDGNFAAITGFNAGSFDQKRYDRTNYDYNGITRGQAKLQSNVVLNTNDLAGQEAGRLTITVGGHTAMYNGVGYIDYGANDTVSSIVAKINDMQFDVATGKYVTTPFHDNTGNRAGTNNDDNQYNTGNLENGTQASYVDSNGQIHYIAQLQASIVDGKIVITSDHYSTSADEITVSDTSNFAKITGLLKSGVNRKFDKKRTDELNRDWNGITKGVSSITSTNIVKTQDFAGLQAGTLTLQLVSNSVTGTAQTNKNVQAPLSSLSITYGADDTVDTIVGKINNLYYDYKTDKKVTSAFTDASHISALDDNDFNTGNLEPGSIHTTVSGKTYYYDEDKVLHELSSDVHKNQSAYVDADGYIHYKAEVQASYDAATGYITITSDVYDNEVKLKIVDTGNFATLTGLNAGHWDPVRTDSINTDWKGIQGGQAKLTGSVTGLTLDSVRPFQTSADGKSTVNTTSGFDVYVGSVNVGHVTYDKNSSIQDVLDQIENMQYVYDTGKTVTSPFTEAGRIAAYDDYDFATGLVEGSHTFNETEAINAGYTIIHDVSELQNISATGKYILMNNIDLSGVNWSSSMTFKGELNGNGFSIKGFHGSALFNSLNGAKVSNLNIEATTCTANGVLANSASGNSKITNVNVIGKLSSTSTGNVGGLLGEATATEIDNCAVFVDVIDTNAAYAGGLVGKLNAGCQVKNSFACGTVKGKITGGLVGVTAGNSTITNSIYGGTLSYSDKGGLLVGKVASGTLTLTNSTALTLSNIGFVGQNSGTCSPSGCNRYTPQSADAATKSASFLNRLSVYVDGSGKVKYTAQLQADLNAAGQLVITSDVYNTSNQKITIKNDTGSFAKLTGLLDTGSTVTTTGTLTNGDEGIYTYTGGRTSGLTGDTDLTYVGGSGQGFTVTIDDITYAEDSRRADTNDTVELRKIEYFVDVQKGDTIQQILDKVVAYGKNTIAAQYTYNTPDDSASSIKYTEDGYVVRANDVYFEAYVENEQIVIKMDGKYGERIKFTNDTSGFIQRAGLETSNHTYAENDTKIAESAGYDRITGSVNTITKDFVMSNLTTETFTIYSNGTAAAQVTIQNGWSIERIIKEVSIQTNGKYRAGIYNDDIFEANHQRNRTDYEHYGELVSAGNASTYGNNIKGQFFIEATDQSYADTSVSNTDFTRRMGLVASSITQGALEETFKGDHGYFTYETDYISGLRPNSIISGIEDGKLKFTLHSLDATGQMGSIEYRPDTQYEIDIAYNDTVTSILNKMKQAIYKVEDETLEHSDVIGKDRIDRLNFYVDYNAAEDQGKIVLQLIGNYADSITFDEDTSGIMQALGLDKMNHTYTASYTTNDISSGKSMLTGSVGALTENRIFANMQGGDMVITAGDISRTINVMSTDRIKDVIDKINEGGTFEAGLDSSNHLYIKTTEQTAAPIVITGSSEFAALAGLNNGSWSYTAAKVDGHDDFTKITGSVYGLSSDQKFNNMTSGAFTISADGLTTVTVNVTQSVTSVGDVIAQINASADFSAELDQAGRLVVSTKKSVGSSIVIGAGTTNYASVVGLQAGTLGGNAAFTSGVRDVFSELKGTTTGLDANYKVSAGDFIVSVKQNGETVSQRFTLSGTESLSDVAAMISNSSLGVSAIFNAGEGSMSLKAKNAGAIEISLQDGTSNFAETTGFTVNGAQAHAATIGSLSTLTSTNTVQSAQLLGFSAGTFDVELINTDGSVADKRTITIAKNDTVDSIISKINNCGLGLTAGVDSTGRLVIQRNACTSAGGIRVEKGTSDFTNKVGLTAGGMQSDHVATSGVNATRTVLTSNNISAASSGASLRTLGIEDGTFKINGETILVKGDETIASLLSKINATFSVGDDAGVYAEFTGGRIVLTGNSTKGGGIIDVEAGTSNITEILGFTSTKALDVSAQDVGLQSIYSINGTEYTSNSNIVSLDESANVVATDSTDEVIRITLNKAGSGTIDIGKKSVTDTANKLASFVNSFNAMTSLSAASSLKNDAEFSALVNSLMSALTDKVGTYSQVGKELSAMGITIYSTKDSSGNEKISIAFNKDKFINAFLKDPQRVTDVLVGNDSKPIDTTRAGSMTRLANTLSKASSYFTSSISSLNTQAQNLALQIAQNTAELNNITATLALGGADSSFEDMSEYLAQLQAQYDSVNSLIKKLKSNYNQSIVRLVLR